MAVSILDPVYEELAHKLPESDIESRLRDLAERIGLSIKLATDIRAYAETKAAPANNRELVRSRIREAINSDSAELLKELARVRVFCETAITWGRLENDDHPSKLADLLVQINQRMRDVFDSQDFSDHTAKEVWELDGKFHKVLCEPSQDAQADHPTDREHSRRGELHHLDQI